MTDAEDALKWRKLMDYWMHWPYSGYRGSENNALVRTIGEIARGDDPSDGYYSSPKKGVK